MGFKINIFDFGYYSNSVHDIKFLFSIYAVLHEPIFASRPKSAQYNKSLSQKFHFPKTNCFDTREGNTNGPSIWNWVKFLTGKIDARKHQSIDVDGPAPWKPFF